MGLYTKIRQLFQPYYVPKPKPPKKRKRKKKKEDKPLNETERKGVFSRWLKNKQSVEDDIEDTKNNDLIEQQEDDESTETGTYAENEYEIDEYERYASSPMYDYHRKLMYLIHVNFIDFMEEVEKNKARAMTVKHVVTEVEITPNDLQKDKVESVTADVESQTDLSELYVSRIGEQMAMPVYDLDTPFADIKNLDELPEYDTIWYYHDKMTHQVLAHLPEGSGHRRSNRSNSLRRKLVALIKPTTIGQYDRTHLISFGYHGSEGDNRLLVGWDSEQNRGPFNKFEQKQKARKEDIYWLVRIDRLPDLSGAVWKFEIYDMELNLLDELEHELKAGFKWSSYA